MQHENVVEWLRYAKLDMQTALHLRDNMHPKPIEIICYHCQQAAEKYLKAFLLANNQSLRHTHDTQWLCRECARLNDSFRECNADAAFLAPMAIVTRYPAASPEPTESDMLRCINAAQSIQGLVLSTLGVNGMDAEA